MASSSDSASSVSAALRVRTAAGAANLPFWPLRNYARTDIAEANPLIKSVTCPYTGEELATVPALRPDCTIVHAQRADGARGL